VADDQLGSLGKDATEPYSVVAARRLQWDNLLWQVPVLSLTAQAFLFTIALGGGSSRLARCIAALLSVIAATVSMILMAGHRHSELTDAQWLADYEERNFGPDLIVHGVSFKDRRDSTPMLVEPKTLPMRFFALFARKRTFNYWMSCLLMFGLAAFVVLVLAIVSPGVFQ
jgi:hypothetical protein